MSLFYVPIAWRMSKYASVEADSAEEAVQLIWEHPRTFAGRGHSDFGNITLDFKDGKVKILKQVGDLCSPIEVTEEWLDNLRKER